MKRSMIRHHFFKDFPASLLDDFEIWHENNPHIWKAFVKYAFQMIRKGKDHYGAKGIIERLRWDINMESTTGEVFEINDKYTSIYARLFLFKYPAQKGFFELRQIHSKNIASDEERKRRRESGEDEDEI